MKGTFGNAMTIVAGLIIALVALSVMWIVLSNLFGFSAGTILKGAGKFVCDSLIGPIPVVNNLCPK